MNINVFNDFAFSNKFGNSIDASTTSPIKGFHPSGEKLKPLSADTVKIKSDIKTGYTSIPFRHSGANVQLTERCEENSAVDLDLIRRLPGYTDKDGKVLPYLFVEGIRVFEKGKGTGRQVLAEIIKLANERYGGRLLLKPENKDNNPSPFYAKCGLLSTTEKGAKEIEEYFSQGKPFESGYSDPMYLPIGLEPEPEQKQSSQSTDNWKLYTVSGFQSALEKYASKNPEARKILDLLKTYGLKFSLQKALVNPDIFKNILSELCELNGVKPDESPKVYRFISDEELAVLKKYGKVQGQRYLDKKMDVTINPNLNWNKYRVTFKQDSKHSILGTSDSKIKPNISHEDEGYFYMSDGYSLEDIEKIEYFDGKEYIEVK